ncbi:30S ribosomal protein S20 [Fervidobacterium nodosum]|uniref:Small ribosomal subunit protein bS20 n=1 Tax=Fervidobacterium nodosum (strain ATCC 35602 / DSM 5306 / Rt17-B1) TaxID=381764 RepID=RS20_FERNB|nr:30S ribosomal protein S20 [Fervidobacterium nodosum]A7HJB0.1 RecName: Full=Small ribosomal subunit protein bS20; AltName: Full=30S ribosomal protein S20 [Fervidobacterium nodosum Rt17-B1]ABS59993.1 ribosomal protein S20 [Fervidobacterium nodosum Rt17-B1]PHJ14268.1 30S ribosomal protein S20 [Fervidobacterium sp. SC_NGM5_G05]
MPNKMSAEKRVRVSEKRRVLNKAYKTSMKNKIKAVLAAIAQKKSAEEIMELFRKAQSAIDKAAKSGAIHKNQASRRKSRLAVKVKAYLGAEKQGV